LGLDHRRLGPSPEALEPRLLLAASVLTYHNDGASTGQDLAETTLTPADVNTAQFGKLATVPLDGAVYGQPLYVPGVSISGQGVHNVVYVATERDCLYAIDADTGAVLWKDSFIDPVAGITTVPTGDVDAYDILPEIGITSTPVIDAATGALYLVAETKDVVDGVDHYVQTLHAIDITSGAEALGGPVVIADTSYDGSTYTYNSGPSVAGDGAGSINGVVTYNTLRQNQRSALTLADGNVYIASASHGDNDPYHGWIIGYSATTLALTAVFNADPNGSDAGIWESGGGLAVDSSGDLYFETGNGTFDTTPNAAGFPIDGDYGDSFVKVAPDSSTPADPNINGWGLKVVDYFTPSDQATLNDVDEDLGSGGPMLLPASAGDTAHPNLLIGAGKEGTIYLIDCDNMGHYDPNGDHVVQESAPGTIGTSTPGFIGGEFGTAAYFDGSFYYGGIGDHIKQFSVADAAFNAIPASESPNAIAYPGATPNISADGSSDGILWALDNGANGTGGPAVLDAYDASNLSHELHSSAEASGGRDQAGPAVKFSVPTVADGHVFVGTENELDVYGLLASIADAGFEEVPVGSGQYRYDPTGSPWAFSGTAGISGNGSGFTAGNPPAPQGSQVAFLQETGSFSQTVSGWAAGSYVISFDAAQRSNFQASRQDFAVLVDGNVVGTFTPSGTSYQSHATAAFTVAAGMHTITFQGLDSAGGDNTAFIDQVIVTQ
jgi:hypothetical protein